VNKYIRWQALLTILGIVLVAAVLFRLSFSQEETLPTHPISLSSETMTIQTRGGTFVEGVAGYPQFINPLFSELNDVDRDLCALIFEGLTTINERNEIVPLLAERWTISDDGLTYTFYLRESVRWQDGEPFTADDVRFTIELLQNPDFPGLPYLTTLWQSVEVRQLNRYTIQFTLHEPYAPFLDYTTIGLVPKHVLEDVPVSELKEHPFNYAPVGTGLFKVQELTPEHIVLVTNPYHRSWSQAMLDAIEFKFYPSYEHILAAYEAGEIMGISRILAKDIEKARSNPDLQVLSARLSGYSLIFLNLNNPEKPFFQDQRVRQAMLYALDRQGLIDRVLGGQGLVVHSPIMPQSWAYNPDVQQYDYNPERAKRLLEQAGWEVAKSDKMTLNEFGPQDALVRTKRGQLLEFTLLTNDVPDRVALAHAVAEQWRAVGIRAYVQAVSMSQLTQEHLYPREFDAVLLQWQSLPPDPDAYPVWHSTQIGEGGQNYAGFVNRDADEAIEIARQITDRGERTRLYYQFQEIFGQEVPAILLYQGVYTYCVDNQVRNVQIAPMLDPSGRFYSIAHWAVQEKEVLLCNLNDQIGDRLDKSPYPWYDYARQ
jgi:peptide/nickel transport system substrate-binding protein